MTTDRSQMSLDSNILTEFESKSIISLERVLVLHCTDVDYRLNLV